MVTLRLARAGTKKRPFYHLVATDSRNRRDGRFNEKLGFFNPAKKQLVLKLERVKYWLSVGAIPSERVKHLLAEQKNAPAAPAAAAA